MSSTQSASTPKTSTPDLSVIEGLVLARLPSDFAVRLDGNRPHILLTRNPDVSPSLQYRYTDTNETATVPNTPHNQSFATRATALLWYAQRCDQCAAEVLSSIADGAPGDARRQAKEASVKELTAAASEMRLWAAVLDELDRPAAGSHREPVDEFSPPRQGH